MRNPKRWLVTWWDVSRTAYLIPVLLPVILVGVIAFSYGKFDALAFAMVIIGVAVLGLGCYLINDYYDYKTGVDAKKEEYLSYDGLSRAVYRRTNPILDGRVRAERVLYASLGFFAVALPIGIYLTLTVGYLVFAFGILGFLIAYLYSAPPVDLSSHGLGEIFPGIAYGPLAMIGTYYVLSGSFSIEIVIISIPVGVFVSLVRWVDAIPGYEAHRAVGETKLTVVLGRKRAVACIPLFFVGIYLSILIGIVIGALPYTVFIALLTLPIAVKVIKLTRKSYDDMSQFMPAIPSILKAYALTIILVIIGYGTQNLI